MAELQGSDDTKTFADVGTTFDATPSTVLDEANNGGGFTRLNQPTSRPGNEVPRREDNPGLRGYFNDHDADDRYMG